MATKISHAGSSDSLYHGHSWQTLNPGFWKIKNGVLRRRMKSGRRHVGRRWLGRIQKLYGRTDQTRSLLGEEQFAWLQEQLATDSSPLICLTPAKDEPTIGMRIRNLVDPPE